MPGITDPEFSDVILKRADRILEDRSLLDHELNRQELDRPASEPKRIVYYMAARADNNTDYNLFNLYDSIVVTATALSKEIKNSIDFSETQHQTDIRRQQEIRKAERLDQWKLWAQKFARWVVGIFAVIFLYSTFSWLTTGSDFWKIPVKETIEKFAE